MTLTFPTAAPSIGSLLNPRRVVIADDSAKMREALLAVLEGISNVEVVGAAADGREAVEQVERLRPDVILMDMRMPNMNGVEAAREICTRCPDTAVIMHSAFGDESLVAEALAAGARGFVLKGSDPTDLVNALAAVETEGGFLSESVTRPVFERLLALYGQEQAARAEAEAGKKRFAEMYEREKDATEQLRELDETKNAFLTAVSHELRTPLTSILGISATLERGRERLTAAESVDLLGRVVKNAEKLDRLLMDLLDLDRTRKGLIEPQRREVDVAELARATATEWMDSQERTVEVSGENIIGCVDAGKVERIIENLLANAAKHTPESARIWMRIERDEHGVRIIVEDDGVGVPDDMKDSIFEAFVRGPTSPKHSPGTGIGLSIVGQFSRLHGGRAWVEDRPGGGSSFHVSIPDCTH